MTADTVRLVSWNLNGGVIKKIPLLEGRLCCNDVVFVQEQFLSKQAVNRLEINDGVKSYVVPASSLGRKRPPGDLAILSSCTLNPSLYKTEEFFVTVKVHRMVV